MWYILDLIVIAIVLVFVITSAKKGFAKTFIELVGFVLSIYLAFFVGNMVSTTFYDKTVEPAVIKSISGSIENTAEQSVDKTVEDIWSGLPKTVTNSASHFGVGPDTIRNSINNQFSERLDVETIAKTTSQRVLKPVLVPVIKSIIGIAVFTVLMFVVRLLTRITNKMFKLPVIGKVNTVLGGVIGLGKGVVIAFAVCMLISLLVTLTGKGIWIFTKENIDKTYIFSLLSNFKFQ